MKVDSALSVMPNQQGKRKWYTITRIEEADRLRNVSSNNCCTQLLIHNPLQLLYSYCSYLQEEGCATGRNGQVAGAVIVCSLFTTEESGGESVEEITRHALPWRSDGK